MPASRPPRKGESGVHISYIIGNLWSLFLLYIVVCRRLPTRNDRLPNVTCPNNQKPLIPASPRAISHAASSSSSRSWMLGASA